MKMRKRLLALALCLGLLPAAAAAQEVTARQVLPMEYGEIGEFHDGLARVGAKLEPIPWSTMPGDYACPRWGYADETGKLVIPMKYTRAEDFFNGQAAVRVGGLGTDTYYAKWGVIDTAGNEVIPCQYAALERVGTYYAARMEDDPDWTLLDKSGKELSPYRYETVRDLADGLAAVERDGKWGFVDAAGQEVIPCRYDKVHDFSEGFAAVQMDRWGLIDKTGREVIPCQWSGMGDMHEGLVAVERYSGEKDPVWDIDIFLWGYMDAAGNEVIPFLYTDATAFDGGLAKVQGRQADTWGLIDRTGKELTPLQYKEIKDFKGGLARASRRDENGIEKWGFLDRAGREVVACRYLRVNDFSEGLAAVAADGGWGDTGYSYYGTIKLYGYVDAAGNEVIPCQYHTAGSFRWGVASVGRDTGKRIENETSLGPPSSPVYETCLIDRTGKALTSFGEFDKIAFDKTGGGLIAVRRNGLWGFLDAAGNEVVHCRYEDAGAFSEGLAPVKWDGKWGFVDATGQEVVPCQFDCYDMGSVEDGYARMYDLVKTVPDMVPGSTLNIYNLGLLKLSGYTVPTPPAVPDVPAVPAVPAASTAYASTQEVLVDGRPVTFHAYALKDDNGFETNYIKLRDVADVLSGTPARFQVGWDGTITITTGAAYTPNGTEMEQNFQGDQTYAVSESPVTVDGAAADLEAITLTDRNGGGYTYFKLRDLGEALGFDVSWTNGRIVIDSARAYSGTN